MSGQVALDAAQGERGHRAPSIGSTKCAPQRSQFDPIRAARCSKMVEQVGHGAISTVQCDEFVAVRRLPIALGAGDQDDCAWLVP
jgi:hypothetical protein